MKRYKFHIGHLLLLGAISALLGACGKEEEKKDGVFDDSYKPVKVTPVSGLRIMWDYSSMKQLASKGTSPKMIRASDGSLVAVYGLEGVAYLTRSTDDGQTWSAAVTLFAKSSHTGKNGDYDITYTELAGQPAIIQLADGDLVAVCAVRYQYTVDNVVTEFPAAVRVRRINSTDFSFSSTADVYVNLGVEHPSFLLLPDGRLQLYFANGAVSQPLVMINSTGMAADAYVQQIVVIESTDNGQTWTSAVTDFGPDGVDRSWTGAKTVAS
ncbi:MAG: glycoside hydrolase, partial [Bacteroidales bacterium]|nr:glycoside hydrolase [Bacteroidales bacterium]